MSNDYRDYVFKDGTFIGAFEEMYQNCPDPWHQDEIQPLAEDIALLLLRDERWRQALDIGCGKGRFTRRLNEATNARWIAIDVSMTAVEVARSRCPDIDFHVARVPPLEFSDATFDLVVSSELLWYVLPELQLLFDEIARVLVPGGSLLVIQHFYQPGEQQYGSDVMSCPEDLLNLLPFEILHWTELDRFSNHKLVALTRKKER